MPGHGADPIFFNEKNRDWTSTTLANPPLATSNKISFLFYPAPSAPPSKRTSYVYHILNITREIEIWAIIKYKHDENITVHNSNGAVLS